MMPVESSGDACATTWSPRRTPVCVRCVAALFTTSDDPLRPARIPNPSLFLAR
jgi:hypothetical protein